MPSHGQHFFHSAPMSTEDRESTPQCSAFMSISATPHLARSHKQALVGTLPRSTKFLTERNA